MNVSVEILGPPVQVLTCYGQDGASGVRLDSLDDKKPQFYDKSRTFTLISIPDDTNSTSNRREKTFVLQSQLNQQYLGFGFNDRRLFTRSMQFPPPESFRFHYESDDACDYYDVAAPTHIAAVDGKPVNDPNNAGRALSLSVRFLEQQNPIGESWKQQSSIISAIGGYQSDEDDFPGFNEETPQLLGGGHAKLDNSIPLEMVQKMKETGELQQAIDLLAEEKYDDAPNVGVKPEDVLKVARLLCIMDLCVYMRDFEREEEIHQDLKGYAAEIREDIEASRPVRDAVLDSMRRVQEKKDRATQKIQEVAEKMSLEYQPLCNFSSNGSLLRNGPYCGAFYRRGQIGKPFIVLAFKGTGPLKEWVTDVKFGMKEAVGSSPLRGRCHIGFFDGVFKDFPGDLSMTKEIRQILPFQMLRNQLWKLERTLVSFPFSLRVQLWFTGHSLGGAYATNCWAGYLADMHFMRTTVRGLVTFGSPRVGNRPYATLPGELKGFRKSWRFVNGSDVVTKIPVLGNHPFDANNYYKHVDSLVEISPSKIKLGPSELRSTSEPRTEITTGVVTAESDLETITSEENLRGISFADHGLKRYWDSLQTGRLESDGPWF